RHSTEGRFGRRSRPAATAPAPDVSPAVSALTPLTPCAHTAHAETNRKHTPLTCERGGREPLTIAPPPARRNVAAFSAYRKHFSTWRLHKVAVTGRRSPLRDENPGARSVDAYPACAR